VCLRGCVILIDPRLQLGEDLITVDPPIALGLGTGGVKLCRNRLLSGLEGGKRVRSEGIHTVSKPGSDLRIGPQLKVGRELKRLHA
jgi:hypothetical protein